MTSLFNNRQALPLVSQRHPYVRLYRAIILRAVQDLARKQLRNEARQWLLSSESDYAFGTAGIDPNSIRKQMTSAMKFQVKRVLHEVEFSWRKRELAVMLRKSCAGFIKA